MTRLTAMIIADDPEVYATSYDDGDGKFGIYIGTYDESPSGCKRPRALLTTAPTFATEVAAREAATTTLAQIRNKLAETGLE